MKSWAIAIGLSVALHLGLVVMLGREAVAAPVQRVAEKPAVKGEVVSFTPVTVVDPPAPPAAAPPPPLPPSPSRGRGSGRGEVVAPVVEVAAAEAVNPHPDPLPEGEGDMVAKAEGDAVKAVPSVGDTFVTEAVIVGPSPDVIALVHARLAAVADRCYPAAARRFQQRGTVQLSFCTNASGSAESTKVIVTSGAELLDAAARGCVVENASPFPAVAASRCFSVPVRFGAR